MKKKIIFSVMMLVTIALALAQVEEKPFCTILVSGNELSEVTADFRLFNNFGRLSFRVRNRLRNDDVKILNVEVIGKNARGDEISRTFSTSDIEMEDDYDGIIPHRSERITIYI